MPINQSSLKPYYDPQYQSPSTADVRELLKQQAWTGARAAMIVGVDSRTVRRWTGGKRPIPYSSWRLLLINAGLADC